MQILQQVDLTFSSVSQELASFKSILSCWLVVLRLHNQN